MSNSSRASELAAEADSGKVLVPLLLLLTVVSGLVDATSYLKLGHTFVANMTGNIVFVGFALAGASGLSASNSIIAIVAFLVGGLAAGRVARGRSLAGLKLLAVMAAAELGVVVVAIGVAVAESASTRWAASATVALLAAAMGVQSSGTTRLRVGGFNSTVVLTTMLSTIASESRLGRGSGEYNGRRLLAVGSMFAGALLGAALTLRVARLAPLFLAVALLAFTCSVATYGSRSRAASGSASEAAQSGSGRP